MHACTWLHDYRDIFKVIQMKFKQILGFKFAANLTLGIILFGSIIFTLGFGANLLIARQEVSKEVNGKVESQINYLESFVEGQLMRIEDAGYSLGGSLFGKAVRGKGTDGFIELDELSFVRPTPDECYLYLEQFMEANPLVCGIAMEFAPSVYSDVESTYGFTPYVTQLSGSFERLDLGMHTNSYEWDWWILPNETGTASWVSPFRDTSIGHVIACYAIPVIYQGSVFAVIAVDIDTEAFSEKCKEISPYPNASTMILDKTFRFISHENRDNLLKSSSELEEFEFLNDDDSLRTSMESGKTGRFKVHFGGQKALFYFAPVDRTGWMISIFCPEDEIYGGVNRMKRSTTLIALFSILVMILSLLYLFRRMQSITASKAGIESELKIASSIQSGMLPKLYPAFPEREDLDVFGFQKPAKSVGGDLYDYFIRDEKFFFCIGDVSGKGVPASLYMAVTRALFRNVSLHQDDPAEIVKALNIALSDGNTYNMFCTMFVGVLDLANGHLDFCNGGHNAPMICRENADGSFDVTYAKMITNLVVGVFPDFEYIKEEAQLNPGDIIFMYTDGLTEAENTSKELFGESATLARLKSSIGTAAESVRTYVDSMYDAVLAHTAGAEQSDDLTMLVLKYKGPASA